MNRPHRGRATWTIRWQRVDEDEVLECCGLTANLIVRRLRTACRNRTVIVRSVERDEQNV